MLGIPHLLLLLAGVVMLDELSTDAKPAPRRRAPNTAPEAPAPEPAKPAPTPPEPPKPAAT